MILYEQRNSTQHNSGTILTLTDTIEAPLKIDLYGNTSQDGTPNPDYLQEVKTVSGNNKIIISGKNIFDYITDLRTDYLGLTSVLNSDGSITTTGIPTQNYVVIRSVDITGIIEDGATYTLSVGTADSYMRLQINATKIEGGIDYINTTGRKSISFVANSSIYNKYVVQLVSSSTSVWGSNSRTITNTYQIEKNTTYTDFEPYKKQSYPINLGNYELCKIEDYKDSIFYNTSDSNLDLDSWYIKKEINKSLLNITGGSLEERGFRSSLTLAKPYQAYPLLYCNYFLRASNYASSVNSNNTTPNMLGLNSSGVVLCNVSGNTTKQQYLDFFSNNDVIVYYPLLTPTYTKITDETLIGQLDALAGATSYKDITNITQTNNDLPFNLNVASYINPLDLTRNGLGYLPNVLNAQVVDEINGEYSLTFEYPINDAMASELVEDRIVKCQVADGSQQCFVIKTIQKDFDKVVVYCTHLFYMLNDNFLDDVYPQNLSPKPFLEWILSKANYPVPFVVNSDIVTSATARYVRKNVVEAILGNIDNSMYHLFGMELKRDNWNIGLKARLGSDKGEKLIFGKNIAGVNVNIDTTGVYTRIMPIGFNGLLIPEKYVDASNINEYPYPKICLYEFPDIIYDPNDAEAYHTQEEAYQALRNAVTELYAKGINKPQININIDWLELSKTEEYKNYSALERVSLGDTITCNLFGMDYETRVIKTTYNPLTDRVEQFEIGTFLPSIASTINQTTYDIQQINPSSILEQATENATNLITQAMGGYVYKTNNELYIMDNPDPNQAVKVWRWNLNGLGYSSTGINGTYGLAMTMDGSIVADFITTGQLSANVINASTIIGVINGNTSQLKLNADQIYINGVTFDSNQKMTMTDGNIEITDTGGQNLSDSHIIIKSIDNTKINYLTSYLLRITRQQTEQGVDYKYITSIDGGDIRIAKTDINNNLLDNTTLTPSFLFATLTKNGHTNESIIGSKNIKTRYDTTETFNLDTTTGNTTITGTLYGNDSSRNGKNVSRLLDNTYVGTGVNLNDYKQAGQYGLYGSNTNSPTTSICTLEVIEYSPDWVVQILTEVESGKKWQRTWSYGNTWNSWNVIGFGCPYAMYYSSDFTQSFTPWANTQINFTSGTTSWATNSDDFSLNGNFIRTNFNGVILIFRQITHQHSGELDINDELGSKVGLGYNNNSMSIAGVSPGDNIKFEITTGASSVQIWNVRLFVIRVS